MKLVDISNKNKVAALELFHLKKSSINNILLKISIENPCFFYSASSAHFLKLIREEETGTQITSSSLKRRTHSCIF